MYGNTLFSGAWTHFSICRGGFKAAISLVGWSLLKEGIVFPVDMMSGMKLRLCQKAAKLGDFRGIVFVCIAVSESGRLYCKALKQQILPNLGISALTSFSSMLNGQGHGTGNWAILSLKWVVLGLKSKVKRIGKTGFGAYKRTQQAVCGKCKGNKKGIEIR